MRIGDVYIYVGYRRSRRNCSGKRRFLSEGDAAVAAAEYNRRVVFANMNHYWCGRDQAWHIGHRNKNAQAHAAMRRCVEFFVLWGMQCQLRHGGGPSHLR